MPAVDFYFDYVSPYAYLGWQRARQLGLALRPRPVVFAALLKHGGQLGPAEIPAKRRFLVRDCLRTAKRWGVELSYPPRHPFRSLDALRVSQAEVAGAAQVAVVEALWNAAWTHGVDLSDLDALARVLDEVPGVSGSELVAAGKTASAKDALREATEAAIGDDVFGVPTFGVERADGGRELIWGADRMEDVSAALAGDGAVDEALATAALARPQGVVRRAGPGDVAAERGDAVARLFERAGFMKKLGVTLAAPPRVGEVRTALTVRGELLQQDGFVHAAVVAGLADHSAGAAAATMMSEGQSPLTVEYKVNFMRPAVGQRLECTATVLRAGRSMTVAQSEVTAVAGGERKVVAVLMATVVPSASDGSEG